MGHGLDSIEKIQVAEKPPKGARQAGVTPGGRIVWQLPIVRGVNEPLLDEGGNQVWEQHPTTNKPMYPRNRLRRVDLVKTFTLEQDGLGNMYMQDYEFPTPEELAKKDREKKVEAMKDALAEALVDQGLTAEELIRRALAPQKPVEEATDIATPEDWFDPQAGENVEQVWPQHAGGPWYLLSNGMKVKGKAEAEQAQAALDAPRDNGDEIPEL